MSDPSPMTAAERLQVETLKLLLQVVFADRQAADGEVAYLMGLARDLEVPEAFQQELLGYLRGHRPLPSPDLALLRPHREGVLAIASLGARADGVATPDEQTMIGLVERMLSG